MPRSCSTAGSGRSRPAGSSASATTCCAPTRSAARATARPRPPPTSARSSPPPTLPAPRSRVGQVGARCENGFLLIDGAIPAARPLRPAGQQLSRLRLCLVLGLDPRRCRAPAGGVRRMIHTRRRRLRRGRQRAARRARRRHQDDRAGDLRRDVELRHARRDDPADQVRRRPRRAQGIRRAPCAHRTGVGLPLNLDGSDSPAHPVGPRLRPQPPAARPARAAVGRALVDGRGRADDDRGRHEPRQAREKIDAHAAAHILQAAIDALSHLPR